MDPDQLRQVYNALRPFLIGGLGAFVAAVFFMPDKPLRARLANLACGALVAGFMGPFTMDFMHLTGPGIFGGVAFLWGLVGLSLMQALLDVIRSTKFGDTLLSWLERRK